MLIYQDANAHKKFKRIDRIANKKMQFSQQIKNAPKFNFFIMKNPILTTYKPSQTPRSDAMYQNVPQNEINVPSGTLILRKIFSSL